MPYGSRYNRKSYRGRRGGRTGYRKPTSKSQDVQINLSKLWKQVKYFKSLINVEKKFFDSYTSSVYSTTANLASLGDIAQGDGESTRDGNSVRITSMHGKLHCVNNASATGTIVRVILFTWNNDTSPVVGDILEDVDNPLSPLQTGANMFKVLKDFSVSLDPNGNSNKMMKYYIPMNHKINWTSTAGSNYQRGMIWRLIVSNEATNTPTVAHYNRLRYVDN